jgi:hypothetical protein
VPIAAQSYREVRRLKTEDAAYVAGSGSAFACMKARALKNILVLYAFGLRFRIQQFTGMQHFQ